MGAERTYAGRVLTRTKSISGSVLVVAACPLTEALLDEPVVGEAGLTIVHAAGPDDAMARVEGGERADVVLLAPRLADPVRVAQRLHSLDRDGAVIVLTEPEGEQELRHALEVAPFLSGDVSPAVTGDAAELASLLSAAARRTQERREAAAAREQRRQTPPPLNASYLGTLLDSVPIGLVTLDATGAVIGWNKRTGEMLDMPEVEALGRPFAELFAEEDHERFSALIETLGSAGIEDEGKIFRREGRAFEVTGARFSIRSGEGGALLILQDVTKRLGAEREVDLQRALMAAQADSSDLGITVVSNDGTVERMNRRWTQIWGIDAEMVNADRESATRMMLEQVVDPEAFMRGNEALLASDGGDFRDEVALVDGRVIGRFATHVLDEDGQVVGRIWFHADITAHRREEDSLRFLADATNLLSSSLEYEVTLERVADLAVSKIADWCVVEIADRTGHAPVAIAHTDPEKAELVREFRRRYTPPEGGYVGDAIRTGESTIVPELTDAQIEAAGEGDEEREILWQLAPRSVMAVPIKVRERVFGAISFIRSTRGNPYDDDDLRLAEELARRAAIAIDNSRVHAELRDTARTLQESLLPPHLPEVPRLELAARFRPAGAGMQVGGDFYDIFELGTDRWGIAIGDVCGKGAEAAALTALTRYTVRAAAMYEQDGAGVLRVLNEALLRQRTDFRFTTLAFCIVDFSADPPRLYVACGGHPGPLVLRPDGSVEAVGGMGPLLGVVANAEFRQDEAELEADDVIVLYTDGLTDALAPEKMLSEDELIAALAS